jgi:hypothetical protein
MTTTIPLQGGNTQLSYGLEVNDPIIADGGISMTLVASNPTTDTITFQSVALTFPEGTNATDLIAGGTPINTQQETLWTVGKDGGSITFTAPDGGVAVAGQPLTFVIQTTANASPGTANVLLTEMASDPPGGSQQGTGTFSLTKFPIGFSLSDLTTAAAAGLEVPYGTPAMLSWVATGEGVSCSLNYQPADSGEPVDQPVDNASPADGFQTEPLTRSDSVTFTLTAKVPVLGQDDPLVASRQCTVSIEAMSLSVWVEPATVGPNGLALVQWNAPNANSCTLDNIQNLPASGSQYVAVAETRAFTVSAFGPGGQNKQQQATVSVDPTIVATETGHVVTGGPGGTGSTGYVFTSRSTEGGGHTWTVPGGTGGQGGDASLTAALPPLVSTDSRTRVIAISLTGGPGGQGGDGGDSGRGGSGGTGGAAVLAATWDPSQDPPAQYLLQLTGGPGGGPGAGSGGQQGGQGSVSATVDGQQVYFA